MQRKKFIVDFLKFLLFLAIGAGILFWVYISQSRAFQEQCAIDGIPEEQCSLIRKLIADFRSVNILWLVAVIVAFQLSNVVRALRWQMICKPLGYKIKLGNAFWTIMLSYFANLGLSRAGEVIRAGSLARYEKIKLDNVVGTVALDRFLDLVTMSIAILIAFFFQYEEIQSYLASNMRDFDFAAFSRGWIFQTFVTGIVLFFLLVILFRNRIRQSLIYLKIKNFTKGVIAGMKTIRKIERPFLFAFYSILIWVFYFLMTYFAFFSFPPTASLGIQAALLVFVFGSFGILIPSPGGMGTYHALVVAALAIYGIRGDDAFSYANIVFFNIQILTTILFGVLSLIFLPINNKHYIPHHILISDGHEK
ncbi:MAG TPA: lysylphosphatidylglycerol synthase transmembrane domain-containing protein [Saprospiraceae bacterium]|nr:flippase-like domain-containing protein [Candidatus Parvibacillus calidus]MBX2938193.1 flippase-like domain-containing protein [Saprospiraceae bacterium]MBX7178875.1 flippase-like domain-containing protein [Saprospiraceae bacterium]MCB0591945.1 flippase-like domain-containing protein [Saprospiraceae bacterium]MCC7149644.1 flippase-like domain-containing protein [Saprospiraceae bacterium]